MSEQQNSAQIQVELDEATAQGQYSNLAVSNYSQEEFILDFVFLQPQVNKAKVKNRIIMSPRNIKKLAQLLTNQSREYESKFGEIKEELPPNAVPFNLN